MPAVIGDSPPEGIGRGKAASDTPDWYGRLAHLLVSARAGDRASIAEMVQALTPLLWNVARAEGLDRDAAEDAVQTAWLALLRGRDDIRAPRAMTAWLMTVTRRIARELRNDSARRRLVDPDAMPDLPSQDPPIEDRAVDNDRYRRLWWNVQQLSPQCRTLLRIVAFVERPDYDTVSEALQMPRGSIGPTRGRCLTKLRQLLATDPAWGAS
jgi:RNA polymerase sigma factor (sigma-70 family)